MSDKPKAENAEDQGPENIVKQSNSVVKVVKHTKPTKTKETKEEEPDFIKRSCDPCKFENTDSKAHGFCRVCREYLCEKCETFHRKFQSTRGHRVVHGVLMPKPVKKSVVTCEYHKNFPVDYYCKDHSDVFCGACKDSKHKSCMSVVPILFFAGAEIQTGELQDVELKLKQAAVDFKNVLELRELDIADFNDEIDKCRSIVKKIRHEFNAKLDKIEGVLEKEIEQIHHNEFHVMKDHIQICDKASKVLQEMVEAVVDVNKTEDNVAIFAAYTKATRKLTEYQKVLKDIKRDAYTVELDIQRDKDMDESLRKLSSFGEPQMKRLPKAFYISLADLKRDNMRVVETLVHSVRMPGDDENHDCEITGSIFMHDGSLIICDKHNYKIKQLDRHLICKHDLKLPGAPWDVAAVNENWVITTLPCVKKLQFVHVDIDEGLRKGRAIQTERMCWGVAASGDEIFISCHNNPGNGNILVLDKRGHTKKTIGAHAEDSAFTFDLPSYIAVSIDGSKLFVADGDTKRTITCMLKRNGQILYDYSATNFGYSRHSNAEVYQNPWSFKIIVDKDDYVYANLGDKEMIQVISDAGVKHSTLLRNTEELFGPHTISYREADATLIISLWDRIQSFRFKEIEI